MTYNWMVYDPATGCIPHSAGAKALAAYLEDRFPYQYSGGICNCRNINGGSTWSHHAECRAYDCMIPTDNGAYIPEYGDPIIELLGPHGRRLGLDHVILNRVFYADSSPDGRYYSGRHPHYNHAHIGLNTLGANNLTYATLVAVLGDPFDRNPPPGEETMLPLEFGDVSEDIRLAKDRLNMVYNTGLDLQSTVYDTPMKLAVAANLGKYTGEPGGIIGAKINAKMWNGLLKDFTIKFGGGGGGVDAYTKGESDDLFASSDHGHDIAGATTTIN